MAKVTPITEHFQHFVSELKESFWGDLPGQVQRGMCRFFELLSRRQRDRYLVSPQHSLPRPHANYGNGYHERAFSARLGTPGARIPAAPEGISAPGAEHVSGRKRWTLLIREAFVRGSRPAGGAGVAAF